MAKLKMRKTVWLAWDTHWARGRILNSLVSLKVYHLLLGHSVDLRCIWCSEYVSYLKREFFFIKQSQLGYKGVFRWRAMEGLKSAKREVNSLKESRTWGCSEKQKARDERHGRTWSRDILGKCVCSNRCGIVAALMKQVLVNLGWIMLTASSMHRRINHALWRPIAEGMQLTRICASSLWCGVDECSSGTIDLETGECFKGYLIAKPIPVSVGISRWNMWFFQAKLGTEQPWLFPTIADTVFWTRHA